MVNLKSITKGTPEQFLNAVERRIAYLEDDATIESSCNSKSTVESAAEITFDDTIDWLSEHDQAYQDCQDYFGVDDLHDVAEEDLDAWISDHDRLFEDYVAHFGKAAVGIESATDAAVTIDTVLNFLSSKGYDISTDEVKNYAEGVVEYMDMSRQAYENEDMDWPYTLDQWYKDTQQNYPEDLAELPKTAVESATNTVNIGCATAELTPAQLDDLWNIADSFVASQPVSGEWNTETAAEQQYIADHFDCSLEQAKQYMINYLGFEPDDTGFKSDSVESSEDVKSVEKLDPNVPTYDVVEAASTDESQIIWDVANDFAGYSYPITDSFDHDTLLEIGAIARRLGCSLEEAADKMIDILGFEPEDVDIHRLAGDKAAQSIIDNYLPDVIEGANSSNPHTNDVVEAADDDKYDDDDEDDEDDRQLYIDQLSDKLNTWAADSSEIDSILLDDGDDDVMYITITYVKDEDSEVLECELPYEDLTFGDLDDDFNYVVDEINGLLAEEAE